MAENFRDNLRVVPSQQEEKKAIELEAYRIFISETIAGYIGFMEIINDTITRLIEKGIIGETKLRTRLKAIDSALVNSQKKVLDDVFGFEIVAQSERDKEILMLIIYNLFAEEYARHKNFNKSNGYFAHHCTGTVKKKSTETKIEGFENHILNAVTCELKPECRDLSRKEQKQYKKGEIYCNKPRYPVLKQEILDNGRLDIKLQQSLENILDYINHALNEKPNLRTNMPIVEMQFKTLDVEQEVACGRAQHVKYKRVNEDQIIRKYFERKLARGVDFPFVFIRNNKGDLEIEHTSKTLISMWPFLEEAVHQYKKIHTYPVANYDMFFAKVFPELGPYVQRNLENEPSLSTCDLDEKMAWSILKIKIINDNFVLPDSNEIIELVEERN